MSEAWIAHAGYTHAGEMIYCAQENGRRFFTARVPDVSGWSLTQEFGTADEARRYIDSQHANFRAAGK